MGLCRCVHPRCRDLWSAHGKHGSQHAIGQPFSVGRLLRHFHGIKFKFCGLATAIADAQLIDGSSCVFLDVSKSDAFMEQATNVAACIRPTHDIYSHQLGRKLTVPELWCCQGLWRDDFPCPQTIDELLNENPSKAQDLAGLATG